MFLLPLKYDLLKWRYHVLFSETCTGYASTCIFLPVFKRRKDNTSNKRKLRENSDCFKILEFTLNYL